MSIVKVGRGLRHSKTNVIGRQVIVEAHDDRFPVPCVERGTREDAVEAPDLIQWHIGVETVICLPLMYGIEFPREKLVPVLVRRAGRLTKNRVLLRYNIQCQYRLRDRQDRKFNHKWSGGRACSVLIIIVIRKTPVQKSA